MNECTEREDKFSNLLSEIRANKKSLSTKSGFEIDMAKLVSALALTPALGVEFDFARNEKGELEFVISPSSYSMRDLKEDRINLSRPVVRRQKLHEDIGAIHEHLGRYSEDGYRRIDDILLSSLDKSAHRSKMYGKEMSSDIRNLSIKLNAMRKLFNDTDPSGVSEYESLFVTILATLDYLSHSNITDNPFSRLSVNENSFEQVLSDIEVVNRFARKNLKNCYARCMARNDYLASMGEDSDMMVEQAFNDYYGKFTGTGKFSLKTIDASSFSQATNEM